jgi:glucose-6-phosphate dehydrogenase assembly protein OpcA
VSAAASPLLPGGVATPFAEIESTMARLAAGGRAGITVARSLASTATGTVVAVGPRSRLVDAAAALQALAQAGGIRGILIASGNRSTPDVSVTASEIALEGLCPEFVDNAVAALRLPSLPSIVWWRGGEPAQAEEVARLADRLVLDVEDPAPLWARIDILARKGPISDLRWTALTRWRALMAHFFDLPGVAEAAAGFTSLRVAGSDKPSARLLAGWVVASLRLKQARIDVEHRGDAAIEEVRFGSDREELWLRRLPGSGCVEGHARLDARKASRIVSMADQSLTALMAQEVRVRSRDVAFEAAVRAAGAIT